MLLLLGNISLGHLEISLQCIAFSQASQSGRVGKKWEIGNPVPGPFLAKIQKVNQNSESRREFGK